MRPLLPINQDGGRGQARGAGRLFVACALGMRTRRQGVNGRARGPQTKQQVPCDRRQPWPCSASAIYTACTTASAPCAYLAEVLAALEVDTQHHLAAGGTRDDEQSIS